jgi:hypothetical protein
VGADSKPSSACAQHHEIDRVTTSAITARRHPPGREGERGKDERRRKGKEVLTEDLRRAGGVTRLPPAIAVGDSSESSSGTSSDCRDSENCGNAG